MELFFANCIPNTNESLITQCQFKSIIHYVSNIARIVCQQAYKMVFDPRYVWLGCKSVK